MNSASVFCSRSLSGIASFGVLFYVVFMGKSFRFDALDQGLLLPPSLHDWLPEGHLARFVADVVSELDLGPIYASYDEGDGRGLSAYSPEMMTRVLLYGYATGVYSSRKMQARTHDDVAFRYLSADEHPDHSTLAEFRRRHLSALAGLFVDGLKLCRKAGLVKLGHVALDGTKVQANASKHKAMSYARMGETEQRLDDEVKALLERAEQTDAAEDAKFGRDRTGDELPAELARRESRLTTIRAAKAALEAEARERAEVQKAEAEKKIAERREREAVTGKKPGGRDPQVPDPAQAVPEPKAQRNFTDPESRIMPSGSQKGAFLQGCNAQAAVDEHAQVIVAVDVVQQTTDNAQLQPMLEKVKKNLGELPAAISADSGFWSPDQVAAVEALGVDPHVATGREKQAANAPEPEAEAPPGIVPGTPAALRNAMQRKLASGPGRDLYRKRKAIVEPVFGQIKECRGFRRFSLRGLEGVQAEWSIVCLTHNLLKLFRSGFQLKTA
jgi:transposase